MSDTDYINDHMGGFGDDGLPNFLSDIGEGGMDGYGDVDYAYYHLDERALKTVLFAVRMTLTAVETLPYSINDKTDFNEKSDPKFQYAELIGIADCWQNISNNLETIIDLPLLPRANIPEDYYIFIHPKKEVLNVTFTGKKHNKNEPSTVEFSINPESGIDEDEWRFGVYSALSDFNKILEGYPYYSNVKRLTKEQFDAYLAHKITIRDIYFELDYLNKLDDVNVIKDKLIKDKLVNLVTEMERFPSPSYKRENMDEIKILVEIPTKDNPMPTFKIEPSEGVVYKLYEMSPNGDVISLHSLMNKTLKEGYSLIDGMYSVPLLDLVKTSKINSLKRLNK